ncbi:unnamed protein product [Cyprideis torosa]|uniref:Uncharacterized protein n=1 Tax=Cyprideis torosa TaxID=163714 RepID=A0A7R8ZTT9_9CRUS|nr:unnamed protein product [Cyprideis torosa]CAG0904770.1 unnamed protein product [Cyprideis torosa]
MSWQRSCVHWVGVLLSVLMNFHFPKVSRDDRFFQWVCFGSARMGSLVLYGRRRRLPELRMDVLAQHMSSLSAPGSMLYARNSLLPKDYGDYRSFVSNACGMRRTVRVLCSEGLRAWGSFAQGFKRRQVEPFGPSFPMPAVWGGLFVSLVARVYAHGVTCGSGNRRGYRK